jgi:tetratricopeptide (TPR) repeat protein
MLLLTKSIHLERIAAMNPAAQRAIKAALNGEWNEAVEFNLEVLLVTPNNVEALNRLARAYAALGQSNNAKRTWNKVISLDRYNPIATSQLEKIKSRSTPVSKSSNLAPSQETFLEEPGKTKTTPLVRLASNNTILNLEPAQPVHLKVKKRLISVLDSNQEYIGSLPDDLSSHLLKLIKAGNTYTTLVRRVKKNTVHIFIKEKQRAKRYLNSPTFSPNDNQQDVQLDGPLKIQEDPINIAPTGEEDDYR